MQRLPASRKFCRTYAQDERVCEILREEEDFSGSTGVIAIFDGRKNNFHVANVR